ncbi:MAG TPA: hypothetical protein VLH13_02780 [Methanomassiliicoccales archaeon]|nr:hypothetical protein [Methanomassiliicoccales archaeon]
MKWRSHASITRKICSTVALDQELTELMVEGSVEPDRHPVHSQRGGRTRRIPHHGSDDRTLLILAWKSRKAFLSGETELGCLDLGRLLHYVQDRSVRFGFSVRSHDRMEEEISRCKVPTSAIRAGLDASLPSPYFVKRCIKGLRPCRDPAQAMYRSTATSAALVGAILGGLDEGDAIEGAWSAERRRHLRLSAPAAAGVGMAAAYSAFMTDCLWLLPASPVIAYLVLQNDFRYHRLRELRPWYSME